MSKFKSIFPYIYQSQLDMSYSLFWGHHGELHTKIGIRFPNRLLKLILMINCQAKCHFVQSFNLYITQMLLN